MKELTPSNSPPANGLASHSSQQQPPRHQPFPYRSQSTSQSHYQNQQPLPVCTWSAHASPFGPSPSPFPRSSHALTATATADGELFLFGGYAQGSARNDLHVFSTWDFSTTLLQTSGEAPSPRTSHGAALASRHLLIWGGITNFKDRNVPDQLQDNSLYVLDLGTSYLLMSRPTPPDESFLCSSIARVDPRRSQWSWAQRPSLPYHDRGRFQALRLRRSDLRERFQ
jgi:hypothetical protein